MGNVAEQENIECMVGMYSVPKGYATIPRGNALNEKSPSIEGLFFLRGS
jgi:hypothetical protein